MVFCKLAHLPAAAILRCSAQARDDLQAAARLLAGSAHWRQLRQLATALPASTSALAPAMTQLLVRLALFLNSEVFACCVMIAGVSSMLPMQLRAWPCTASCSSVGVRVY